MRRDREGSGFGSAHKGGRLELMGPIDKKFEKDVDEGEIPKPIEDLPSEWEKEDREIDGAKPDLEELEEDPSGF